MHENNLPPEIQPVGHPEGRFGITTQFYKKRVKNHLQIDKHKYCFHKKYKLRTRKN